MSLYPYTLRKWVYCTCNMACAVQHVYFSPCMLMASVYSKCPARISHLQLLCGTTDLWRVYAFRACELAVSAVQELYLQSVHFAAGVLVCITPGVCATAATAGCLFSSQASATCVFQHVLCSMRTACAVATCAFAARAFHARVFSVEEFKARGYTTRFLQRVNLHLACFCEHL